ncbi:EamA family transporter [Halomonas beimenensis]|uniref:Permease of the drug/metabolite transporter (DMT) superfamily n=1 Tax=Halomonas beimenensis TaxID=475662 RepID=A0A291P624_9GAMM|nr:EamA family transporter [Halomonas beimenensis]ATJ82340.1 permease of the drug/metabolite transporter (DMT) superfamily [Halomonas beimenensis]
MPRSLDLFLTALAPAVWGSTYYVTTEFMPAGYPVTLAVLRALPAGLLLLALVRRLPGREWLGRVFLLGAVNFAIFWTLLFVAAYRLPGGVAATLGSLQALCVILLARGWLGTPIVGLSVIAALAGAAGVALLVLTPSAALDPLGLAAGLGGAVSMAAGTVLSRRWQPPVSPLTFTAWQLTAGGLLLVPIAWWHEPPLPALDAANLGGMAYLGLVGAALTYYLWFRGVARIEPAAISMLGMMSPLTAVLLGWWLLEQRLTSWQLLGAAVVLGSVWLGQWAARRGATPAGGRGLQGGRSSPVATVEEGA